MREGGKACKEKKRKVHGGSQKGKVSSKGELYCKDQVARLYTWTVATYSPKREGEEIKEDKGRSEEVIWKKGVELGGEWQNEGKRDCPSAATRTSLHQSLANGPMTT